MTLKILNLYAGIGGNRKLWDEIDADIEVTAVEINEEIAEEYQRQFPDDEVIIADAHEYLKEHYQEFDFIWSSPPCPTHSKIRKAGAKAGQYEAKYPDMKLYQEIIFLDTFFNGDWVVENVEPHYQPLIKPQKTERHLFWSNLPIPKTDVNGQKIHQGNCSHWEEWLGIQVKDNWQTVEKRKVLRNAVHPEIGKAILQARNTRQTELTEAIIE